MSEEHSKYQIGGDHYINMAIQPIKALKAWLSTEGYRGFLTGNAIKYLARFDKKGGVEDLRKAKHYIELLIEHDVNLEEKVTNASMKVVDENNEVIDVDVVYKEFSLRHDDSGESVQDKQWSDT